MQRADLERSGFFRQRVFLGCHDLASAFVWIRGNSLRESLRGVAGETGEANARLNRGRGIARSARLFRYREKVRSKEDWGYPRFTRLGLACARGKAP